MNQANYFEFCETRGGFPSWLEEGENPELDKYREREKAIYYNEETAKKFVNVYRTKQCYGGPEEGGWYYTEGEFLGCYGMYAPDRANLAAQRVKALMNEEPTYHTGYGDHDGVDAAGDGDDHYLIRGGAWGKDEIVVRTENQLGENYPKRTPRYC